MVAAGAAVPLHPPGSALAGCVCRAFPRGMAGGLHSQHLLLPAWGHLSPGMAGTGVEWLLGSPPSPPAPSTVTLTPAPALALALARCWGSWAGTTPQWCKAPRGSGLWGDEVLLAGRSLRRCLVPAAAQSKVTHGVKVGCTSPRVEPVPLGECPQRDKYLD